MHPARWTAMGGMLLGLPPAGVLLRGDPLAPYLVFPPRTRFIDHAPFSWMAFILIGLLVGASVWPLVKGIAGPQPAEEDPPPVRSYPWWGWAGVAVGLAAWGLAWTRLPWFAAVQPHTFPLLWGAFIVVVNAQILRRTGSCPMTGRPVAFAALFPASAAFWWVFEYLNRFVQNWAYSGADYPPGRYFLLASLSFATVLPAVMSVRAWLRSFSRVRRVMGGRRLPAAALSRRAARGGILVAGAGLLLAGAAPNLGFPFLWLSPLLIVLAFQVQEGRCPLLAEARRGDWGDLAAAALSGLLCGFFWEMWNFYSLARWTYAVPFVDRFHLFEMPILGYAGYLPFGLECAVVGDAILRRTAGRYSGG